MKVGLHGRRERRLRKPIKRRRIKMQFQVRRGREGRELQANLVPAPPHIKTWWLTEWNAGKAGKTRGKDHILPPEQKRKPRTTTRMVENAPSQSLRCSVYPSPLSLPGTTAEEIFRPRWRGRWTAHHLDIHQKKIRACGTIGFAIIVFQTASDMKGLFSAFQNRFADKKWIQSFSLRTLCDARVTHFLSFSIATI